MEYVYFCGDASKHQLLEKTKTLHDLVPAMVALEDLSVPGDLKPDLWKSHFRKLCDHLRQEWQGIKNLSACIGINKENGKICIVVGLSSEVYSLSLYILDHFAVKIMKLNSNLPLDINYSGDEVDTCDPSLDLIQIQASPQEVDRWIESFINGKRSIINIQNIKDFCTSGVSQNCARVDAVLVKRKNTSGHIGVEHVSNYWGPQLLKKMAHGSRRPIAAPQHDGCMNVKDKDSIYQPKQPHLAEVGMQPPVKKKVLSATDITKKLNLLKSKMERHLGDSDSSKD